MSPHLCLGTVQFGLPYGVTNTLGQVPESEVKSILALASRAGIRLLDTAQAYGSAEEVLGRCCNPSTQFRLISKLPAQAPYETWESNLQASLHHLRTDRLDSFLLHSAADLLGPDGDKLLDWLEDLRGRGLVDRIGVSIYEANELEYLPLDRIQLVQLPLSLYDQRLLKDGTVARLKSLGIGVHARSLFLQGLLLQSSKYWPEFISPAFREHHLKFQDYLFQQGLSLLEGILYFARSCQSLEAFLIGVLSVQELEGILKAWSGSYKINSLDEWAWETPSDLDPRLWPSR